MQQAESQDLLFKLKQSKQYWDMRKKVLSALNTQGLKNITVQDIQKMAQSCEVEETLKNILSNFIKKSKKREPIKEDQNELLNQARSKWTDLLFKNLEIVYQKSKHQEEDESGKDSKLYTYDERNLLAFLSTLRNAQSLNLFQNVQLQSNRLIALQITVKPYTAVLEKFRYLLYQEDPSEDKILRIKRSIENETLESELERIAQDYVPNGDRCQLYLKYFELDHSEMALQQNYVKLQKECKAATFFDELLEIDANEISEDTSYFVFHDQIINCLKCFMRDKHAKETMAIQIHHQKQGSSEFHLPNCGFLPFRHISKYIAPICYLSTKSYIIYAIFKEFFCRYFCFLHALSSEPNSILSLCIQIEEILSVRSPKLFHHLKTIGQDALRLVIGRVVTCFIGEMETQQIFYILDKILAHNSLEILIVLAVGFLNKFKPRLLLTNSAQDIEKVFEEFHEDSFQELVQLAYQ